MIVFEENNDQHTVPRFYSSVQRCLSPPCDFDITLGNHALSAQPTDYSASRYLTNLLVALISKINCRVLANEKTDSTE